MVQPELLYNQKYFDESFFAIFPFFLGFPVRSLDLMSKYNIRTKYEWQVQKINKEEIVFLQEAINTP